MSLFSPNDSYNSNPINEIELGLQAGSQGQIHLDLVCHY